MITNIHIKNVGIIDDITIEFKDKFNVITGETGAGKSLIINSLNLISGGRFKKELIRNNEDFALVEVEIFKENETPSNIVVSREIYRNGRNSCKINGNIVTVNTLKEFMRDIIDIHGQNDNQDLLEEENHIKILDNFASCKLKEYKEKYDVLFKEACNLKAFLAKNYGDEREKKRKLDLLYYQLNEINSASLKVGEEYSLEEKRNIMRNYEKISKNLNIISSILSDNIIDNMSTVINCFENIETYDVSCKDKLSKIKDMYYELEDISRDIADKKQESFFDEEEYDEIEKRLDIITSLKRKYGNTIEEILEYKEEIQKEIIEVENVEENNKIVKEKLSKIKKQMKDIADKMYEIRKEYIDILEKSVNEELESLEMKNAKFKVEIIHSENEFNKNGLDKVRFIIKTNVGDDFKALSKIASGGEISRIMLSLKSVIFETDTKDTLVFDEIDTGISGNAANVVGEKIRKIAKKHQVIAVTHQAILTAKANHNFMVKKVTDNLTTKTVVKNLTEEEIINEIARISGGSITKTAIEHAKELRKTA